MLVPEQLSGVWSATPSPFTESMEVDTASVARMVEHHLRLGIKGLFLAGTCGEGPWMTDQQRRELVRSAVQCARGRLIIAVQVTDNSAARILANARMAAEEGADVAVIAPPYFLLNCTSDNLRALYLQAIRESPLPVGIYDRGTAGSVAVPDAVIKAAYAEQNVVLVKDSSMDEGRRKLALAARRRRAGLRLFSGCEFDCVSYLQAGYDGLLLGGAIFNGWLAGQIFEAVRAGDLARARRLQARMDRMMYAVYGGKSFRCWLSGLKWLLVELGIFSTWRSYLNYPLTEHCRRAIRRVIAQDRDILLP